MKHATRSALEILPAAVLFLFLVAPSSLLGQSTVPGDEVRWWGETYPELDAVHDDAMTLVLNSTTDLSVALDVAADWHGEVADERPDDDVRKFDCLRSQAFLLHGAGDVTNARRYMKRAAEHAERSGQVFAAAMSYVDAALLANQAGNGIATAHFMGKAKQLSEFTFLDAGQRDRILDRLGSLDA